MLLEQAKLMLTDGRLKIVDGVPVLSPKVEQMLAEREARRHRYCTDADPCRSTNRALITPPKRFQGPSRERQKPAGNAGTTKE